MREECGRVVINQTQPEYLGANRATNNTAELSAVHHALSGARELRRPEEAVLILTLCHLAATLTLLRGAGGGGGGGGAVYTTQYLTDRHRQTFEFEVVEYSLLRPSQLPRAAERVVQGGCCRTTYRVFTLRRGLCVL